MAFMNVWSVYEHLQKIACPGKIWFSILWAKNANNVIFCLFFSIRRQSITQNVSKLVQKSFQN